MNMKMTRVVIANRRSAVLPHLAANPVQIVLGRDLNQIMTNLVVNPTEILMIVKVPKVAKVQNHQKVIIRRRFVSIPKIVRKRTPQQINNNFQQIMVWI